MKNLAYRVGLYLLVVATLCFAARFALPLFVGQPENELWEILVLFSIILYILSAVLLFIGRKDK